MTTRGRFVSFEGIDGAGKSSHIEWFADLLRRQGHRVSVTREPGGTELAEAIREWLLNRPMSMRTEALLAFAARQDHLERVIRPALDSGVWVICDRFTDSTVAYQGGGRGIPLTEIETLERWVHPDLQPDRTYLFDLDPGHGGRTTSRRPRGRSLRGRASGLLRPGARCLSRPGSGVGGSVLHRRQ
jgi:dTMP kinase